MLKQTLRIICKYTQIWHMHTVNTQTYSWNFVHWGNSSGFPQSLRASVWVSPKSRSLSEASEGSWICGLDLTSSQRRKEKYYLCYTIFSWAAIWTIYSSNTDRCLCTVMYYPDRTYLFRERTVVSLGYVFSHSFSHRLDFFAQGNTRCWWRFNGISHAISVFILIHIHKRQKKRQIKPTSSSIDSVYENSGGMAFTYSVIMVWEEDCVHWAVGQVKSSKTTSSLWKKNKNKKTFISRDADM